MLPRIRANRMGFSSVLRAHTSSSAVRLASISTTYHRPITSRPSHQLPSQSATAPIPRSPTIHFRLVSSITSSSRNHSNTTGSYHSPTSAHATLLSDVPSISPRSLVKYLDTYVVGQTRAKKVLAVGVWNHYLRVASNQRMKEEAELRLQEQLQQQQQQEEEERMAQQQQQQRQEERELGESANTTDSVDARSKEGGKGLTAGGVSESFSRSLRLGKLKRPETPDRDKAISIAESWKADQTIKEQRNAERLRDPHGEATRNLMFGRSEREWLVNAGGPSAIVEDDTAPRGYKTGIVPKFGDDLSTCTTSDAPPRRVPAKTPAEEASSQLEQQRKQLSAGEKENTLLAEAASRMHEAVLSDFTPATDQDAKGRGGAKIGVFGQDEPLYFSSNTIRTASAEGGAKSVRGQSRAEVDEEEAAKKWESPQERAAYAAGLAEERTKRALKLARERLAATSSGNLATSTSGAAFSPIVATSASPGAGSTASASAQLPPSGKLETPPNFPSISSSSSSFLSTTPGNLPFFEKSNILLLGPSGSGKTLLLRTLAQALDVPFVHVDATPLTMAGYVGEDVESIIQRLLVQAGWDVNKAQRGIVCIDEIDKLRKNGAAGGGGGGGVGGGGGGGGKDVGGEGVQQALLRMLEGTTIQISDKNGAAAAANGDRNSATLVQQQQQQRDKDGREAVGGLGPWYNNRNTTTRGQTAAAGSPTAYHGSSPSSQPTSFSVDTSSILFVLSGAFVGIEEVIRKRLSHTNSTRPSSSPPAPPANTLSSTSSSSSSSVLPKNSTEDLTQTELLSKLEPTDLESYGLIPEFIGRVPVSVVLQPLSFSDMVRIMTEPKNSLVDQYTSLFKLNGIELYISPGAVEEVVHRAMGTSSSSSSSSFSCSSESSGGGGGGGGGARSLRRIMEEILLDAFYESYGNSSVKYILVDRESVKQDIDGQVKLFSRGQRFDFESRCKGEMEEYATLLQDREGSQSGKDQGEEKGGNQKGLNQQGEEKEKLILDQRQRAKIARWKAKHLLRSRVRRLNRLVDPVIYI
ncbi:related to atp-dependent clp protease, atp-binding subunit [Ustilago trichophora]|uniref:Related to atp-dependent clp protease, atp-binding subunit n=1 Tax=Ustilago trichophora TaxID=86804 RepID=A0A5C3E580_9BASI|nr:related to atp-dependent clp protease, atp-binding subunit [Ustilago trichophora]